MSVHAKIVLSRVLFSLSCLFCLALSGCKTRGQREPILLGHVAPLSGPEKALGEHAKQAIELAIAKTNKEEKGIEGRHVAVLQVDSRGEPGTLQPEAVRLITINGVVALLGGTTSAEVERLGQAAQPYGVALVTPAALPPGIPAENVFSVNAGLSFRGQVLARFASQELKAERSVVLLDGRRTSDMAVAEAFQKAFAKVGGQVPQQYLYKSAADLARAVQQSKNAKPQAILYAGAAADLATARDNLREAGLTIPLLFGGDAERLATQEPDTKTLDGIYLITPYVLQGESQELQEFTRKYRDRFQEAPDSSALLAYDAIRVLVQAMRKEKALRPAKVRAGLAGFLTEPFESLTGRILFTKDHSARRPLFVVRLEEGKMQAPVRFDPGAVE
jgi:branched-chain amino acid transport system substrate-binding protein